MSTYDLAVVGGTLVDGSGLPRRRADVMVKDGQGRGHRVRRGGRRRPHGGRRPAWSWPRASSTPTPTTTPSSPSSPTPPRRCFHGVTTVLAGNCGFSVAPTKEARPPLHHPDVRPGRGHVGRRPRRPALGLRDLPRVPGRPAGPARGQHGLLHRPLRRAPLGHGRRRLRAGGHRRRDRRDGRHRHRGHGGRRGRASRRPTPRPTGTAPTGPCPSRLSSPEGAEGPGGGRRPGQRRHHRLPPGGRHRRAAGRRRAAPDRPLAGRPHAGDHPGPRRPLQGRRPHRGLGQRQALRRRGHRPGAPPSTR